MNDQTLVLTKQEAVKRHVFALKQMSGTGTSINLPIAEISHAALASQNTTSGC